MTLRARLASLVDRFRGSMQPSGTMTLPAPQAQHEELTDAQRFRQDHGYSVATPAAPWTEDISKHNAEVNAEYDAEVERRYQAYLVGEYRPRWFNDETIDQRVRRPHGLGEKVAKEHINWSLEMTDRAGARVDVTKDVGVTMQPTQWSSEDGHLAAESRALRLQIAATENQRALQQLEQLSIRAMIGTRATILKACGGNEAMADQVEAKARDTFGTDDLDGPYTGPTEKYLARG